MSDSNNQDDAAPTAPAAQPDPRKPYQKPSFVREQLFETMALACGKISATSGQCRLVRKSS